MALEEMGQKQRRKSLEAERYSAPRMKRRKMQIGVVVAVMLVASGVLFAVLYVEAHKSDGVGN